MERRSMDTDRYVLTILRGLVGYAAALEYVAHGPPEGETPLTRARAFLEQADCRQRLAPPAVTCRMPESTSKGQTS
jgi:hypothetical protein